jgi:vacuolar protein sorting-associated protein 13A/C
VALREAGASVADQAVVAAQDFSARAFRLALDVNMKAPVVVVPESSRSSNVIILDLGRLAVTNKFSRTADGAKNSGGQPAVLDTMTVDLTQLNISRYLKCTSYVIDTWFSL